MDFLYGRDRKLSDFEDPDMTDILEPDIFTPSMGVDETFMTGLPTLTENENDWFNSIFDEPGLIYNDKNLGEAASQPCIKSEHSYSTNSHSPSPSVDGMVKVDETDAAAIFSNNGRDVLDLSQKAQLIHAAATATQPTIKMELADSDPILTAMTRSQTTLTTHHRPTTIILTTTSGSSASPATFTHSAQTVYPATTLQIKTEPMETYDTLQESVKIEGHTLIMPPTPPSSAGSDSDGSQSPQRSPPSSPQRQSPMPQSGVLILTEEEKRTLISEGYPIPSRLPLTKQEEKNLKKVRRKIKNKISAQESRRKKKEYLEALEKRVEAYNHENSDLKKKVESLEKNNHSLLSQLKTLQALVGKIPRSAAASATQTGTVLMVLVLCFAVFLGGSGGGTSSLNMGYSSPAPLSFQRPSPLRAYGPSMGPGVARVEDTADDYATPNLKSRVLMAFSKEEPEDWCDEYRPMVPWERELSCPSGEDTNGDRDMKPPAQGGIPDPGVGGILPLVNKAPVDADTPNEMVAVVTVAIGIDKNRTESMEEYQAMMHPDIAVAPALPSLLGNFTSADLETA